MPRKWHNSKEFQKCCREFHDACARQPCGKDVDEAKEVLELIKPYIAEKMAEQGIFELKRYEHRGSTYEGVKIAKSPTDQDLEFDVMFVMNGGRDLEYHDMELGGFAKLKLKSNAKPRELFEKTKEKETSYISAMKTKNLFYKHLVGCKLEEFRKDFKGNGITCQLVVECKLEEYREYCRRNGITCKLIYHGPATKVDVYRDQEKFFTLDLAPHFDLSGITGKEEMYVAKAKRNSHSVQWLRSFSLAEKRKFDGMDKDNGCRKMVLRTMKAFVKSRPELSWLTSQHLKTALFRTVDAQQSWKQEEFSQRFMDTLGTLEKCLEERTMPSYSTLDLDPHLDLSKITGKEEMHVAKAKNNPDIDLFENYKDGTMQATKCRFCRLSNDGPLMMDILSSSINKWKPANCVSPTL